MVHRRSFRRFAGGECRSMPGGERKIRNANVQTADFTYFRLRKQSYAPNERAELTKRAVALAQKGDVFLYFKHEDTPEGALYAEELLAAANQTESARTNRAG